MYQSKIENYQPLGEWLNNVNEEFIERFLRQRIERLESRFNVLLEAMGVPEDPKPFVMNRNPGVWETDNHYVENAPQYQLRCRLELAEQRLDRITKSFENLESNAMGEAMKRMTEYWKSAPTPK